MNINRESLPTVIQCRYAHCATRDGPPRRGRKVRTILGRAWVALAAGLATCGVAGLALATAGQATAASSVQWMMTAGNVQRLSQQDPATASYFFNTPSAYGAGGSLVKTPVQRGYATTPVLSYTAYSQFASDVANGRITYPYEWVMYDPENWSATPVSEAQDPLTAMRQFGQLAHANGLKVIMAPSRDLGCVTGSKLPRQRGESVDHWYIRVGIPWVAAAAGDIFIVQDEYNETSLTAYDWLYNNASTQARNADPGIKVFSEVAADFGTADQMTAAAKSISPDGFYVAAAGNIPQTDQFFQQMKGAGY